RLEESYYKVLDQIDIGMSADTEHEIGIWISGFYGSGKSSFTKYLGLALDPDRNLGDRAFSEWLKDRFTKQGTKQRLSTLLKNHEITVIMLDLSTETLAGTGMAPVSTVLYYKVLQWAGYSREKKIALLELMVDRDNRRGELEAKVEELAGEPWSELHDDVIAASTYASKVASALYPKRWPTPEDFNSFRIDLAEKEDDRVQEMLELIERRSGRKNVLFVLDEAGQYVAPDDDRILNLQGLAQNLKRLSNGHAWIMATAQQTLTEDDTRAAINSVNLYKLRDRFPIQIDLEASDIREICYRRLLGKSAEGQKSIEALFTAHGEKLAHMTSIGGARGYGSVSDKKEFVDLYPFLPHHFDLLLRILGRLAKSTGGVGLRSAIKVVQDTLIEADGSGAPFAERPIGAIVTTVRLFDILRSDIEKTFPHVVEAVRRTEHAFGTDIHLEVAKSIAFLQILDDFPLSRENLAALLHERVDGDSRLDEVKSATDDLMGEPTVPLVEVNGVLRFMSEKVNEYQQRRRTLIPTRADERIIMSSALQGILRSEPSAELQRTKTVKAGVRFSLEGNILPVFGDKEEIQFVVDFVPEAQMKVQRTARIADSIKNEGQKVVYVVAQRDGAVDSLIEEIFRSEKIANYLRGQRVDKDVDDYATGQRQLADRLRRELESKLRDGILHGSSIFRGKETGVRGLSEELIEAFRRQLAKAAEEVFDKYAYAAVPNDSSLAERFLKTKDISKVSSKDDPLGLAKGSSPSPVNTAHPALSEIKDYLEINGTVDGRRLVDHFFAAPYGWLKDITRYLVSAMLIAGEIVIKLSNREETVRNAQTIEALKNTVNFNKSAIALREKDVTPEWIARAAERLLEITDHEVLPLEENIARAVDEYFPDLATRLAPLEVQLDNLRLPGRERAAGLQRDLHALMVSSAEIIERLGGPASELHEDAMWAKRVLHAFKDGADKVLREAMRFLVDLPELPDIRLFAELTVQSESERAALAELLKNEEFYDHIPDIQGHVSAIRKLVEESVKQAAAEHKKRLALADQRVHDAIGWQTLPQSDQERLEAQLKGLDGEFAVDLTGLRSAVDAQVTILEREEAILEEILRLKKENAAQDEPNLKPGKHGVLVISVPPRISDMNQLELLIQRLQDARSLLNRGGTIEIEQE
ncbi:MAG TPA: BREX system P-loop protein BrxC, partial [Spirochaetia bacterium]|nr:BREX system P-loop protein BrxC [Spirochaetia bacterium]